MGKSRKEFKYQWQYSKHVALKFSEIILLQGGLLGKMLHFDDILYLGRSAERGGML